MSRRVFCLLVLLLVPVLQLPSDAETILARGVVANGGGQASGPGSIHTGTLGQACIGIVTGPAIIHEIGFWYPIPSDPSAVHSPDDGLPAHFSMVFTPLNPPGRRIDIHFAVPVRTPVAIHLYDVAGRRIRQLVNGVIDPGYHDVQLTSHGLSSGIYFCRMTADGFTEIRRLTLLR